MFKMPSIAGLLPFATVTTTLVLATIIFYPSKLCHKHQATGATQFPKQVAYLGMLMTHIEVRAQLRTMKKAAGLNTCLVRLNQLIPANRADLATKQDLEILLK